MAGIYIHIPFCKKACHYCNFHFSTTHKLKAEMLAAIAKEAILQKDYITEQIETIYFGGGTPSLCSIEEIQTILNSIHKNYTVVANAEITLEANPDDITEDKLTSWKNAGINRLSIGIQSFIEDDLRWMNRAHTADHAKHCIALAQQFGFNNITIDLIYGTPTLSDDQWLRNIETAINFGVPHLSCYALTVEPKTALDKMIELHKIQDVDAEKQARHFEILMQQMQINGYDHYEISNFAKPNYRSQHNSNYWKGKSYLGLGPSAHSFNSYSRQWNVANNALYLKSLEQNIVPFELETLTPTQQLNEYIMISLRTMEGLSLQHVQQKWGNEKAVTIVTAAQTFIQENKAVLNNNRLQLTNEGRLLADGIAAHLFE